VDNTHFDENLKSDFPSSRSLTFPLLYEALVLFVEFFLFPMSRGDPIYKIVFDRSLNGEEQVRCVPKKFPNTLEVLYFGLMTIKEYELKKFPIEFVGCAS
jgi:hypothetical protein